MVTNAGGRLPLGRRQKCRKAVPSSGWIAARTAAASADQGKPRTRGIDFEGSVATDAPSTCMDLRVQAPTQSRCVASIDVATSDGNKMITARRNLLAAASCTVLYAAHRRKRAICGGAELPSSTTPLRGRRARQACCASGRRPRANGGAGPETAAQAADAPATFCGRWRRRRVGRLPASRLGARVTLLEKASCGCERTQRWDALRRCVPERVDASAALYLRAGSASILEALGGCEFNRCGALDVAATPPVKLLQQDFEAARSAG